MTLNSTTDMPQRQHRIVYLNLCLFWVFLLFGESISAERLELTSETRSELFAAVDSRLRPHLCYRIGNRKAAFAKLIRKDGKEEIKLFTEEKTLSRRKLLASRRCGEFLRKERRKVRAQKPASPETDELLLFESSQIDLQQIDNTLVLFMELEGVNFTPTIQIYLLAVDDETYKKGLQLNAQWKDSRTLVMALAAIETGTIDLVAVEGTGRAKRFSNTLRILFGAPGGQPDPGATLNPTPSTPPSVTPTPSQSTGWTTLTPSADSRMVYVSSSLGNDSNDGLSPSSAKRSIAAGKALLRNGYPDWLNLKRGDTWDEPIGGVNIGGRSRTEPMVITSYGSGSRPLLRTGAQSGITGSLGYQGMPQRGALAVVGLHFRGRDGAPTSSPAGFSFLSPHEEFLVEDCLIERYQTGFAIQGFDGRFSNVKLRRNIVIDNYSVNAAHSGGAYLEKIDGLLLEENVFDQNGWVPGIPDATPSTQFRHHIYVQNDCTNTTIRDNFIMRASANGISARSYGVTEGNIVWRNSIGILHGGSTLGAPVSIRNNVVFEGKDIDLSNPRGWGIDTNGVDNGSITDNLIFNNQGNSPQGILLNAGGGGRINNLIVERNILYNWRAGIYMNGTSSELTNIRLRNNHLQDMLSQSDLIRHASSSTLSSIIESSNNRFFRLLGPNTWFSHWATNLAFAPYMALINDTTSTVQQINYPDPKRNFGTYNGSIGRTATPDAFIASLRAQSKTNWDPLLTAPALRAYFRAGFGLTGTP